MKNLPVFLLAFILMLSTNLSAADNKPVIVQSGCLCDCQTVDSNLESQFEPNATTCTDGESCQTSKGYSGKTRNCKKSKIPVKQQALDEDFPVLAPVVVVMAGILVILGFIAFQLRKYISRPNVTN